MTTLSKLQIYEYISTYSNVSSISRSRNILTVLKSISDEKVVFGCVGSYGNSYTITIEIDGSLMNVNCTCPYDYGGLCKHSIAALQELAYLVDQNAVPWKNKTQKTTPTKKQETPNFFEFPIEDGKFDVTSIRKELHEKCGTNLNHSVYVDEVNESKITTKVSDWQQNVIQTFNWNKSKNSIEIKCSCKNKKATGGCTHLLKAFDVFVSKFGETVFSKEYKIKKIENFLKDYNLTLDDDYQDFFDFKLTKNGLEAEKKVPIMSFKDFLQHPLAIENDDNQGENNSVREGVIFRFQKKQLISIDAVTGKLNSEGDDLNSYIKEVNPYRDDYPYKTEKLGKACAELDRANQSFNRKPNASYLLSTINAFKSLHELLKDTFIYQANQNSNARKNLIRLKVSKIQPELVFTLFEGKLTNDVKAQLKLGDDVFQFNDKSIIITPIFILKDDEIYPILSEKLAGDIWYFSKQKEFVFFKNNQENFLKELLTPLSKNYKVEISKSNKKTSTKKLVEDKISTENKKQIYLDEVDGMVRLRPALQYGDKIINITSTEQIWSYDENGGFQTLERNESEEKNLLNFVRNLHPKFEEEDENFSLQPYELIENYWLPKVSEECKENSVELLGMKDLKSFNFNLNKPTISMGLNSGMDWFDVNIDIAFGDQKVNLRDLQKSFVKKTNYITLSDGTIGLLPEEWMQKFAHYFKVGEVKKDKIEISNFQFNIIDELYNELDHKPEFLVNLYEKKKRLQNLNSIPDIPKPRGIKAKLRDYQQHGLNWLAFLDENQLGGCLADDMGLGKTLQTIAFLQHLKTTKKPQEPTLIITPTSLIFNWQNELKKFCPTLKVFNYTGTSRRESSEDFHQYDLILTTYGTMLNDIEDLSHIQFHYVILDESQAIKNPNSKRYKSVRLLKAYNRITLTGTPIENNTFDLFAQFNFLNPGLLGSITHFKKEFSDAIDKKKEESTSELLNKLISPFILRRTKEQVATELPEKIEDIIYCEMDKIQRKVYDSFKEKYRNYLLEKIDENGIEKSQMYILEGLMKLRQICNSPAILSDEEDYGSESAKLETLIENIKEKTGKHKILIFSSFVKMLHLIKERLEQEDIQYEYLDGQTRDRQSKVENFQSNDDVRVFLISTKAGGTGLNLTEADYVFIVDPWWNPAVENQAIDRCYRIGQKKQVMAYRMICKDSIEEKILSLQQRKKTIADSIISVDDERKSFDVQEVKNLFA